MSDVVRFSQQDLDLLSAASGDRNPLHLSDEYAIRTPYGQRVVFGVLGAMACLGRLDLKGRPPIRTLTAEFLRPMFPGIDYDVKLADLGHSLSVRLFDGSVPLLALTLALSEANEGNQENIDEDQKHRSAPEPNFPFANALYRPASEIAPGTTAEGEYACDQVALHALCHRWGVVSENFLPAAVLWSSYLIGMELPGESALFSRLVLHFDSAVRSASGFGYQAKVRTVNTGLSQLRIDFTLTSGGKRLAHGECAAFIRSRLDPVSSASLRALREPSEALAGKRALVIGASRGLGGALLGLLGLQGAQTFSVSRSGPESEQGDAADLDRLLALRAKIEEGGPLDLLICNAAPALLPLRLEPHAFSRINSYVEQATKLVLAPLCVFLELLNRSGGCAVIISSISVEQPVREWPHYIAAKAAIEAFAQVAALQYPRIGVLIVRPERLLTEMTNTPLGRQNAMPPERFAATIVDRLKSPMKPGVVEILGASKPLAGVNP